MTIVAALQYCGTAHLPTNLEMVSVLVAEAARLEAKLIVLPENAVIMGLRDEDKCEISEAFGTGPIQAHFSRLASQYGVWIVAGTIPLKTHDTSKVAAASLVFDAHGLCVARYDKIHLFDVAVSQEEIYRESNTVMPGQQPVVCHAPFGVLGLSVCYDLRFPELYRHLLRAGADIITIPSAFTVKTGQAHWEVLVRARAIENGCYVIAAGQGGVHANGRRTYGHSMIVDPWGTVLASIPGDEPGVICASVDLALIKTIRATLPMQTHRRL